VDGNKKAIADRGWNPLNYILLDHPELTKERKKVIQDAYQLAALHGNENVPLDDLKLTQASPNQ
jgi:hypothetical protein